MFAYRGVQEALYGFFGNSAVWCDVLERYQLVHVLPLERSFLYGYRRLEPVIDGYSEMVPGYAEGCI